MANKGEGLFLVYTDLIDPKLEEEFNAWYNTEHLPELLALPGFLDAARYVAIRGGPKYLAAYELTSPEALQSTEFSKRKRTPWETRMSPRVTGKNVTRESSAGRFFRARWKIPIAGWRPRSRSVACLCRRVRMPNGMSGITANISPDILKSPVLSMRAAIARWTRSGASQPSMNW
jgi:hypothetical protein